MRRQLRPQEEPPRLLLGSGSTEPGDVKVGSKSSCDARRARACTPTAMHARRRPRGVLRLRPVEG